MSTQNNADCLIAYLMVCVCIVTWSFLKILTCWIPISATVLIFDFIQIALKYLEMDSTVALLMINFLASSFFIYFLVLSDILLESSGSRRHVTSDIPGILSDAAGPCMVPSEAH